MAASLGRNDGRLPTAPMRVPSKSEGHGSAAKRIIVDSACPNELALRDETHIAPQERNTPGNLPA